MSYGARHRIVIPSLEYTSEREDKRTMAEDKVRRGLLLKTALEILRDAGMKVPQSQVLEELRRRVQLTPYELSLDNSGLPRFDRAVGFHTGDAATVGWASKLGGWSITDAGIEALETYPDADELFTELRGRIREVDQRRKQAQQSLNDVRAPVHRYHAADGQTRFVDSPR